MLFSTALGQWGQSIIWLHGRPGICYFRRLCFFLGLTNVGELLVICNKLN